MSVTADMTPKGFRGVIGWSWLPLSELPEFDQRPGRHFVIVEGWCEHSGITWARAFPGEAWIRREDQPDSRDGYRAEDIARIEKLGGMDAGSGRVTHWMVGNFPSFPEAVRS